MNYRSQPNCENTLILTSIFKTGLMKYFTFVASILTLFFVCQETFGQVQPNNTNKNLDVNQVNKRLDKLEKELDAKKKDFWDVFDILGSLFIPASITFFGYYYSNAVKKIEIKREEERSAFQQEISRINAELEKKRFAFEQEISQMNAEREEKRDAFEKQITQMNIKARQAELISKLMEALVSDDPTIRTLGITAISLALPEESKAFVKVLSEYAPDKKEKSIANESLKILLENLVRDPYELEHLYRLYEGEQLNIEKPFRKGKSFMAELRHLRDLRLIENQLGKTIGGMAQSGDLRDYVKLTQDGRDYIQSRETYGLANPRRDKNKHSDFWSKANNN